MLRASGRLERSIIRQTSHMSVARLLSQQGPRTPVVAGGEVEEDAQAACERMNARQTAFRV